MEEPPAKRLRVELTDKEKEIIVDNARCHDFFEFLTKYSDLPLECIFDAFGYKLPDNLLNASTDKLLPLLKVTIDRKIAKRPKRSDINTIEDVLELLKNSKKIMVITGAGVSVSCGIPDFRSKNGIYSRLDEFNLDDPQQMFDLDYFKFQPTTFYSFANEIYPSNFKPSPSHMFIKLLEDKGKLLRNYSQNIDTLEQAAGITKIIQCHGSFATAKCIVCGYTVPGKNIEENIFNKTVPICPKCPEEADGILKPSITFFGEKLSDEFHGTLMSNLIDAFAADKNEVDLLIVMGSSLKVSPVADVKDKIPHDIPQILINMEALPHMAGFDVQLLGYCDSVVVELCKLLGWELNASQNEDQITPSLAPSYQKGSLPHRYIFLGGTETPLVNSSDDDSDIEGEDDSETGSDITKDEDIGELSEPELPGVEGCEAPDSDKNNNSQEPESEIKSNSQSAEDVAS